MSNRHKHVIVGGGFSGLRAARLLANNADISVTVINPQLNFEYHGSLYRSANGFSPLETVIPYREIFKDTDIDYVQDFMVDLEPSTKVIKLLSGREMSYDSVTLALGYEPEYFGIPGMREFSKTLYSLADALDLRKSLTELAVSSFHKIAPARVIVVGGGPTGIETAASIAHLFKLATGDSRVEVRLIEAQPQILSALGTDFAELVMDSLSGAVTINCGLKVIRASKQSLYIAGDQPLPYDVLIWTAGSSANSYFRQRTDLFEVDRNGRVVVNQNLMAPHDLMYVIGDSAAVKFSGTAHAAIQMGEYVAGHLPANLNGHSMTQFKPTQPNYAVPTGHNTAVAMHEGEIVTGEEGWQLRRQLDLVALSQISSEDVARSHWLKGDSLASMFNLAQK